MECYRHPGTAATTTCVACSQPICPECREDVAGHPMCHSCVAAASARLSDAPGAIPETGSVEPGTAPWLANSPAASGVSSQPAPAPPAKTARLVLMVTLVIVVVGVLGVGMLAAFLIQKFGKNENDLVADGNAVAEICICIAAGGSRLVLRNVGAWARRR